MRFFVIVVAGLLSLGLAAFGVVSAQKAAMPSASTASNVRVASLADHVPAVPVRQPVSQIAQAQAAETPADATPAKHPRAGATPPRLHMSRRIRPLRQRPPRRPAAKPAALAAATPASGSKPDPTAIPACNKPGGMGLSRIVEIDTTGGPGFGFEHFKQYDFLREKEVVLTFDDGPWPENTPAVLKALADNCLKATFFEIGEHAMWHPEITKQVVEAGMTLGTHTWSHKDLARNPYASDIELAKQEIEMGFSAVHAAASRADRAVLPFPRPCNTRRNCSPIWPNATSRHSRPTSIPSTSRCTSRIR